MKLSPALYPLLVFFVAAQAAAADGPIVPKISYAQYPCSDRENWRWGVESTVDANFRDDFSLSLSRQLRPVSGFSEGLALRKYGRSPEAQTLGEYWIARALYDAKLIHVAFNAFAAIASKPIQESTVGIQTAALACITQIHLRYPTLQLPHGATSQITRYSKFAPQTGAQTLIPTLALNTLISLMAEPQVPAAHFEELRKAMTGSLPHESFAKGIWAAKRAEHRSTITEFEKYLALGNRPAELKRFQDTVLILLARAYYATEQFEKAAAHLKAVSRSSNELSRSLSELSWAYLMDEKYGEAIGTAINLQQGGMRHTFAPEGPMTMAMALNELCQFPESVQAMRMFQRKYEASFRFLAEWDKQRKPLYALAIQFLKKTAKVPERIGSEWVRSPLFLSHQEEINLIFDEQETSLGVSRMGAREQSHLVQTLLDTIQEFKPRLKLARMQRQPGELLPPPILKGLEKIRKQVLHLRRLEQAAPVWRSIFSNYQRYFLDRKIKLIATINEDLKVRTDRAKIQLDEIAENLQLVEVEIYNGATHDIIWQNAHPDYRAIAQKMDDERQEAAARIWNWGSVTTSDEDNGEIWEDELGSFRANLFDNCLSKDKYLAIKMKKKP